MEKVYDELFIKRVVKSKEYLQDIIMQFEFDSNITDDYSARISTQQAAKLAQFNMLNNIKAETINVKNTEQEILDILNKQIETEPSDSTKNRLTEIAGRQSGIKSRTIKLDRNVQEMSRQTAAINPEISSKQT